MKKTAVLIAILLVTITSFAQDSAARKARTNLEQMTLQEGRVIKKVYTEVGQMDGVKLEVLTITDEAKGLQTLQGLRVQVTSVGAGASIQTYAALVDAEEINGLLAFIDFARTLTTGAEPKETIEYVYTTKDFKAAAVWASTSLFNQSKKEWIILVYGDKYRASSYQNISKKNIENFYQAILKAKEMMK
jgi:hypothetical protein